MMDKSTYLEQLGTVLREKYPEPQVRDILSDYEDFFTSGAAEGKSETELCAEFGSPEQAAGELESEIGTEMSRRGLRPLFMACSILVITFTAVFWAFHRVFLVPHMLLPNAVGFWFAVVFPLSLEAVLSIWFPRNISQKNTMKWIPTVQVILAVPVMAVLVWLIHYALSVPSLFYGNLQETGTLTARVTGNLANADSVIILTSVVLFMLYALHGHKGAHWFLFLDTTLLTLTLNFISFLSQIKPEVYDGVEGVALCFLWAILPNLAAAGITFLIRKMVSVRRAKAWMGR